MSNNVVDILLRTEIPQPQQKQFKHKRLSRAAGDDVVFTLQELPFNRVAEIKKLHDDSGEMEVHILLAGVVEPELKTPDLLQKYGAVTPAELVKKLLLPGEISDLAREVERLSGFRQRNIEELEKK